MVQDLSRQMKTSLKRQRLENSVKQKTHQIQLITGRNGKTEYRGWTYEKKIVLQPGWIRDAFEFREPELYKILTTVTRDEEGKKFILYPLDNEINRNQLKSLNMRKNLIVH